VPALTAATTRLVNGVLYQTGWFACVLGAGLGHGTIGAAAAAVLMAGHLAASPDRRTDLRTIIGTLAIGGVVEGLQIAAGTYVSLGGSAPGPLPPLWLLALWAHFATTFRYSLRALVARPWAAVLFGAVGGPVAFLAGERLGAVTLTRPLGASVTALALGWAAAMGVVALAFGGLARQPMPRYRRPPS
jgi:hypothetical protein